MDKGVEKNCAHKPLLNNEKVEFFRKDRNVTRVDGL